MEGKKKLNILIFSWRGSGHPNAGGAEISTHEHAKGWIKAGHSVTLFTSYYQGARRVEIIDGVTFIRKGRQFFGVQWEAFKWYLSKDHPKYDLVIDQFHGISFFTPLYVRVKKLAFIHEVTKEVWRLNQFPVPFNFFVGTIGKIIEPFIFRLYKNVQFMTVSESTKKDLIKWGISSDNIMIIHNGVNVPLFKRLPYKETKKTIIYLGALAKDKGIEDALRTFSILNMVSSDWQFWVVGKSGLGYSTKLKLQSKKLLLKDKIKFWGYVNEFKKFELLAKAHVLINPSICEGWGLVVIEAASVGTPTVAYNVAGLRDSVVDSETGLLCDAKPEALASKIQYLLDHKQLYQSLSTNCFKWSKKFSWKRSVKDSLKLLETI